MWNWMIINIFDLMYFFLFFFVFVLSQDNYILIFLSFDELTGFLNKSYSEKKQTKIYARVIPVFYF